MRRGEHAGSVARRSRARVLLVSAVLSAAATGRAAPPDAVAPSAHVLEIHGARVHVTVPARRLALGEEAILEWVGAAAHAVAAYEGRLPFSDAFVEIRIHGGRGVGLGSAWFDEYPRIRISLGEETTGEDLRRDWLMTHEMFHLGFPSVCGPHRWLEEGLATYLETVARARVGAMTAADAWHKLVVLLPKGFRHEQDRGLNEAVSGPRVYWGGATFWLLVDVELRRVTHGRRGLDDVLSAIASSGAAAGRCWEVERILGVGDRTAGAPVLRDLYARVSASAEHVDLASIWRSLGIQEENGRVTFDDGAPLAAERRAIMDGGECSARAARDPARREEGSAR